MRILLVLIWFTGVGFAFAQSGETKLKKELGERQKYLAELKSKEQVLSKKSESLTDDERAMLSEVRYLLPLVKAEEAQAATALKNLREGVDTTVGVEPICPVHRRQMETVVVPIKNGEEIYGPNDPSPEVRNKLFPFARDFKPGGCIILDTSPTKAKVYLCQGCRSDFQAWLRDPLRRW